MTAIGEEPYDVAILAGGQGSRLKDRVARLPKAMVPLLGRPMLDYQIELCKRHGFLRILLLVHYGHEMIIKHFGDGSQYGISLGYQVEASPRGTAGALRDALPRLAEAFVVLYGDTYLDVDLGRMRDTHARQGADATLFLHANDHPRDSDLVEVDDAGSVIEILPCPRPVNECHRNLVNAALYVFGRDGLHTFIPRDGISDIAKDMFPAMLSAGKRLFGYVSPEYLKDMGTPARLDKVERDIANGLPEKLSGREPRAAVFLDRDGTLNREVDNLSRPEQLNLYDGAAEAVRRINEAGMLTVLVTNQPVVARGDVSRAGLQAIHARLEALLGEGGAYLDRIYVCPHHPDRGFLGEVGELKIMCDCRKPKTGLIDAACRDLRIRRESSWLIGDAIADIEAGRQAGLRTVLVRTGRAGRDDKRPAQPDYVVRDLTSAAAWILKGHRAMGQRLAPVALATLRARLVLIGGLSRSGKSHAAQVLKELVEHRGRTAHVLSLDSWLRPSTERVEGAGVLSRFDVAKAVQDIGRVVDSTVRTKFSMPVYDRATRAMHPTAVELSIAADDIIIIEGVPALLIEPLRALAQVTVHLEVPETERVARLKADYRWRGYSEQSIDELMALRAKDENVPVNAAGELADYAICSESETMILSKTPLRMSFVGGGSDLPAFYREEPGAVLSTSIDKYMYFALNKKFDGRLRISYTRTEDVETSGQVQHPLVREALNIAGVEGGIEIASMADIPSKGSGLGSSSAYTVGLLNALFAYKNQYASKETLARLACEIEIERCGEPIGKQDQYAAAYGGLNLIRFHPDESVAVDPLICQPRILGELEASILLFFTGRTRSASVVLANGNGSWGPRAPDRRRLLRRMVGLAFDLKKELESGQLRNFGLILHENWCLKTQVTAGVSDPQIDDWYARGLASGALGGKLLGAGSGGFLMFFAPPERHLEIVKALSDLTRVTFGFDRAGAQIVFYQPSE